MVPPAIPSISTDRPIRPLIDRHRSSSRERGLLLRPSVSRGSPTASPVGSPPGGASPLMGILKHRAAAGGAGGGGRLGHPADSSGSGGEASGRTSVVNGGGLPVESSMSTLSLSTASGGGETLVGSGEGGASARTSLEAPSTAAGHGQGHSQFRRRVGFDTFEAGNDLEGSTKATGGGTGVTYSFTLSAKSSEYCRTRWSRTFLVATDLNEYSVNATDWLLDSFLEDNDEVVVLRVIEPGSSAHNSWKASMEEARDEAEGVLEYLMKKNGEEKQISLIVEFAIGPIEETIHRMIEIYKPDSLIVGTRGKPDSLFRSAMMGSISRWAVARSPIPVVVVRPDDKVRETLNRRLQDSKRGRSYVSLLSSEEQARHAATLGASGVSFGQPLERTVTAPEAGEEREEKGSGGGEKKGGGIGWALGTKDDGGKKKKDKGKEFKRFGTFS
ncbi:hypothetical protein JCM8547_005390 [Rhodosporidiobolus lusitaniae]